MDLKGPFSKDFNIYSCQIPVVPDKQEITEEILCPQFALAGGKEVSGV